MQSKANVTINGGDYLSNSLNIFSGTGTISGAVGQLTGTLNTVARNERLSANTALLSLGTNSVSGDPTYFNTGDININGDLIVPEDLSIVAGGSITADPFVTIQSVDGTGQGHNITLVAGANYGAIGTATPTLPLVPPQTGGLAANQKLSIIGASAQGGSISLQMATIQAGSGGSGDKDGGRRHVDPPMPVTPRGLLGGIENVAINNGGNGSGKQRLRRHSDRRHGAITSTSNAIDNIKVTSSGGGGLGTGAVGFTAAMPIANQVTFDSKGSMQGKFTPSLQLTANPYVMSIKLFRWTADLSVLPPAVR